MYAQRYSVQAIFWFVLISCQVFLVFCKERKPLNKFIHDYEPLNYAEDEIKSSFENGREVKSLKFKAHGRDFDLRLEEDRDTFLPSLVGLTKDVKDAVNSAVAGRAEGEKNSEVFGLIKDGKFDGTIFTDDEEYTVKPAEKYFTKPDFHSVIYRSKDVEKPKGQGNDEDIFSSSGFRAKRTRRESAEFDVPDKFRLYDHEKDTNLRICNVSMEADYLFTRALGNDTGRAVGEMIYLIRVANRKFEDMAKTKYWGETFKLRLMIGRVVAYRRSTTPEELRPPNMGVSTFLDFFSDRDYDGFCQAFFFTYRDFEGGITGLSWSFAQKGGFCERRRYYIRRFENFNVQKLKSYNTGIVTYKFYGSLIPPKVAEIAFLRQVGTAFGALDDPDTKECRPGIPTGNYIMYNKATNGGRKNNDKFSPCSIRSIVKALGTDRVNWRLTKQLFPIIFCLETPKNLIERRPRCGDNVAHNHEQCDCGTEEECRIKEPGGCCNPKTCTLRRGASCSVNDGPCCDTTTCSHRRSTYICRQGDECAFSARCRNLRGFDNYQCPARVKKGDFKPCATESQVCVDGLCSNSVCRRYGLGECQCSEKEVQCHVCCMFLDKCVAAIHIPVVTGFRKPTLPLGAPCANDTGYCDLFHNCEIVDLELPLERIEDLYYKREDVRAITRKYWWAILLGAAALIAFLCLLIFFCNKYAPSTIPKRRPTTMQMSLLSSPNDHNGTSKS